MGIEKKLSKEIKRVVKEGGEGDKKSRKKIDELGQKLEAKRREATIKQNAKQK